MASKPTYYTVTESFVGSLDGVDFEYHKGEVVDAEDPAARKWPQHFGPLIVREYRRPVEQATAAPGERRVAVGHALTTADIRPRRRGE